MNGAVEWICARGLTARPSWAGSRSRRGHFSITSAIAATEIKTEQRYLPNTNILLTTVTLPNGGAFQIADFCPRFEQYGGIYRPA